MGTFHLRVQIRETEVCSGALPPLACSPKSEKKSYPPIALLSVHLQPPQWAMQIQRCRLHYIGSYCFRYSLLSQLARAMRDLQRPRVHDQQLQPALLSLDMSCLIATSGQESHRVDCVMTSPRNMAHSRPTAVPPQRPPPVHSPRGDCVAGISIGDSAGSGSVWMGAVCECRSQTPMQGEYRIGFAPTETAAVFRAHEAALGVQPAQRPTPQSPPHPSRPHSPPSAPEEIGAGMLGRIAATFRPSGYR